MADLKETHVSDLDADSRRGEDGVSKEQNKKLLLKIDLVVLPLITITTSLAFLDKNAMSFAAVWGLRTDTHLVGQQYSWLGSIFYFGYLFMEFPTMWLLTKVPIGKYVGVCLFFWGGCLCCMAACHNFAGLAVIRFLLGCFEAGMLPSMIIMNSTWYRREEQPLRTALWYNTFAGIFGGILSFAIGKISGSLATWKYIFLIYGSVTMAFGILVFFALPDSPAKAWFFTAEEKKLAVIRTAQNQTGVSTRQAWKLSHVLEALKDPKYWCCAVFTIAQSITNAGITNFNPLIISGYGFSQSKTTLMATPQAAVAIVAQVAITTLTYYIPNTRCLFWIVGTFPALAGASMIHSLDIEKARVASLAGVYLMGFYNVAWVLMVSLQSSNTAGMTKKSFVSISIAVFYATGNIVGPQFFRSSQAPRYALGISAMLCCFAIMCATGMVYWALCYFENKRRDEKYGKVEIDAVSAGLDIDRIDQTDGENHSFRYVY